MKSILKWYNKNWKSTVKFVFKNYFTALAVLLIVLGGVVWFRPERALELIEITTPLSMITRVMTLLSFNLLWSISFIIFDLWNDYRTQFDNLDIKEDHTDETKKVSMVEAIADTLIKNEKPAYGIYRYNIFLRRKFLLTSAQHKGYIDKQLIYLRGLNRNRIFMRFVVLKGSFISGDFTAYTDETKKKRQG